MTREDIEHAAKLFVGKGEYVVLRASRPDMSEFFELMEVIEDLCPVLPDRQLMTQDGTVYKL